MSLMNTRLGLAIVSAIAVTLGAFLADLVGWFEYDTMNYVLTAIAGFVGGLIGWELRRRRT